ncbi:hypothetical protein BJX70DRAFT_388776 [Aspergillus crustosus]
MAPPPVPSAQLGEHQYWTDPIPCKETRARLEHFRSLGWLPPNFKPKTLEGLAVIKQYWRKYYIQLNHNYVEYLLLEDQAMNFFDWMYKTSRKKLLQLYNEYWRRLYQYFGLFARRRVNGNIHEQMRRFLNHVFPAERKIPRRTKKKNTLDMAVFCSDLPQYISVDDLPASVCYRDIELYYLKDPDSKRDDFCAIIEFRNLKGRPEGADRTKFFMHGDYQLAYCPINQIMSLAFRDEAFLNTALTPELIWRLRLGRDARFEDDIGYYNYRRWTANEVNRNFTSQERQRVLGQSGDAHVVLLQPSQEGLLRVAGSMLRKRDPLAPSNLTDTQKRTIC